MERSLAQIAQGRRASNCYYISRVLERVENLLWLYLRSHAQSGARVRSRSVLREAPDLQSRSSPDLWSLSLCANNAPGEICGRQGKQLAIRILEFLQRAHRRAVGPDLGIDAVLQVIKIGAPGRFNGHLSGALRVTDHISE
jgi:hypothetical protein